MYKITDLEKDFCGQGITVAYHCVLLLFIYVPSLFIAAIFLYSIYYSIAVLYIYIDVPTIYYIPY